MRACVCFAYLRFDFGAVGSGADAATSAAPRLLADAADSALCTGGRAHHRESLRAARRLVCAVVPASRRVASCFVLPFGFRCFLVDRRVPRLLCPVSVVLVCVTIADIARGGRNQPGVRCPHVDVKVSVCQDLLLGLERVSSCTVTSSNELSQVRTLHLIVDVSSDRFPSFAVF